MSWAAGANAGVVERSAWESTCRARGKRGDRAQVPEVGKSQLSALMLQEGKMGLWVGIQSEIGIEEYVCGSERLQRECRVTFLGFLVVT